LTVTVFTNPVRLVFFCPILKTLPHLNCIKIKGMALVQNVDEHLQRQAAVKEMLAGVKAAKQLQGALRTAIGIETVRHTGKMMRTRAAAKKDKTTGQLDRITIASPAYSFKLNYGFEGVKSNGVSMSLKPTNHLHTAIEQTNIINALATEIGNIRADEVIASINF